MNLMDFCRFFLVCFLSLPNIGLIESFDFDHVCSSTKGENIEVTYGTLSVKCGQSYLLNDVISIPTIRFAAADKTKLYEVLMFDPDAPSAIKPTCRSWLHLQMSNIPGSILASGISPEHINPNSLKTEYKPPSPPKGSNYHRYIVAVFSHEEHLNVSVPTKRCLFDIEEFGTLHKLSKIPDAVNMFKTKTP